jgi:hypothetical protein
MDTTNLDDSEKIYIKNGKKYDRNGQRIATTPEEISELKKEIEREKNNKLAFKVIAVGIVIIGGIIALAFTFPLALIAIVLVLIAYKLF